MSVVQEGPLTLPKQRKISVLSDSLSGRLNQYAWLAGAAGVSLLALPRAVEAEVVYTPTNVTVEAPGGSYNLDLNNDGITDFVFRGFGDGINDAFIEFDIAGAGEGIQYWKTCNGTVGTYCSYAAALPSGAKIPGRRLAIEGLEIERVNNTGHSFSFSYQGFWHNVRNHYLGLKFQINGQTHYGWARMTVRARGVAVSAQITGYAYETVANQPLRAGQTTANASGSGNRGSLADLAHGAAKP